MMSLPGLTSKVCSKCHTDKPLDSFYKSSSQGYQHYCKECAYKVKQERRQDPTYLAVLRAKDREVHRDRYRRDVELSRERSRVYRNANKELYLWCSAKQRAEEGSIPFNLEVKDICIPTHCPILGIKLAHDNKSTRDDSPSLDKVIPSLGYIKGNVAVIS